MKLFKTKQNWEYHISIGFPGYAWWGILSTIIMLYVLVDPITTNPFFLWAVSVTITIFIFQGLVKFYHKKPKGVKNE